MNETGALVQGREAYARRSWTEAYTRLSEADRGSPLAPDDLARLATAAYLIGKDVESAAAWARAHHGFATGGDRLRAVRCAFWLAFGLFSRGERARGHAWVERARTTLEECGADCVERGYLLLPGAFECLARGDAAGAYDHFCRAAQVGQRFGDPDLTALARHSRGRVLIRMGAIRDGLALLDESMVSLEAGEVSPLVVGDVYCSVIEGCIEIFDLRRAQEWTAALAHWCASQPDLVPYRGQCLVRRAEILQLRGVWPDAVQEAERACEHFRGERPLAAAGSAFYQRAELHRLHGEFDRAEAAYRQAGRHGHDPQPGLARLRLAQGRIEEAKTALLRALAEARARESRARLLPAWVEVALAASDADAARDASAELGDLAAAFESGFLAAAAEHARGAVLLATGDAPRALPVLRQAWAGWQELEIPYEAARVRVLIGLACRSLGDSAAAAMEFDAARWMFEQLSAAPDRERVEALARTGVPRPAAGLSRREVEVLRLVAAGKTNRAIGAELFISERTVERHLSNIFVKLDVASRAAATAYAYEHRLV